MEKNTSNIDWNLAGRILSGEANKEEQNSFNSWIKEGNNEQEWKDINGELDEVDLALVSEIVNTEKAWSIVSSRTTLKEKINTRRYILIGASIAASFIIALMIFLKPTNQNTVQNQIAQTENSINMLFLEDGSNIDLNRNTKIFYPKQFAQTERKVELQGEAFFNISRDEARPFTIETSNIKIKVLGTSFNVKAYPGSNINEVIVSSGIVEVSSLNNEKQRIILRAGDKAIYNIHEKTITHESNNNNNFIAWKTKEISFKNEKLGNAISLLENVYNVKIHLPDNFNKELLYNGTFDKNEIEDIINTINNTFSIKLTYQPN